MSRTYVNVELRREVEERANGICEYCLISEEDTYLGCALDDIISEKHGGPTDAGNLAQACVFCNESKGSDIGSIDWQSGAFVRFFNPRVDRWKDHFALVGAKVEAVSVVGSVTARILGFNKVERLMERRILQKLGRYPNNAALLRMRS